MIGLDCEDARRSGEVGFAGSGGAEERSGSVVGGDPDVLEDIGSDEEGGVAGEGIEGCSDSSGVGEGVEGCVEVYGGLGDCCGAEGAAQEADVFAFFDGGLDGIGADGDGGEGDLGV